MAFINTKWSCVRAHTRTSAQMHRHIHGVHSLSLSISQAAAHSSASIIENFALFHTHIHSFIRSFVRCYTCIYFTFSTVCTLHGIYLLTHLLIRFFLHNHRDHHHQRRRCCGGFVHFCCLYAHFDASTTCATLSNQSNYGFFFVIFLFHNLACLRAAPRFPSLSPPSLLPRLLASASPHFSIQLSTRRISQMMLNN